MVNKESNGRMLTMSQISLLSQVSKFPMESLGKRCLSLKAMAQLIKFK